MVTFSALLLPLLLFCPLVPLTVSRDVEPSCLRPAGSAPCLWKVPCGPLRSCALAAQCRGPAGVPGLGLARCTFLSFCFEPLSLFTCNVCL